MKNADMPASPIHSDFFPLGETRHGFTKREEIAMHLYAGMLSACDESGDFTGLNCAEEAVTQADALLKALENE